MRRLVQWWRWSNDPIVFTQHTYRDPSAVGRLEEFLPGVFEVLKVGAPGAAFYPGLVKAADTVVEKTRFSALADTTLSAHLRSISASEIVICGLTTPICVQATVDDLAMADYSLTVVADACASQATGMLSASEAHTAAIERMGSLFARIESATSMLASSRAYVRHREVNRERAA
jgi:nicotinamidase-related amidase